MNKWAIKHLDGIFHSFVCGKDNFSTIDHAILFDTKQEADGWIKNNTWIWHNNKTGDTQRTRPSKIATFRFELPEPTNEYSLLPDIYNYIPTEVSVEIKLV
jgi:hypothetical protein